MAVNGSATTGHWSSTPKSLASASITSGVVAGVMRSTIEFGKRVCSVIHSASPG